MDLKARFYDLAAKSARNRAVHGAVTLDNRRIYILPTGSGLFFAFIVGATLIGSLNYQSSLGFLFTFLLASVGLVSMVETQRNLTGLTVEVRDPRPVFAGQPLRIALAVRASDGRTRRGVSAFALGGATAHFSVGSGTAELSLDAPPRRRGVAQTGRITLETGYPLGLFRAWSPVVSGERVVVYPAPHPRPGIPPSGGADGADGEAAGSGRGDSPEDFYGLRDFLATDPPSRVHWKSVARTGALTVKEFEASRPAYSRLSWESLSPAEPEERLSILCAWALASSAGGGDWSLDLPGVELPRGRGAEHLRATLEALAAFNP